MDEYDASSVFIGAMTDPTELSVNECMNGYMTGKQKELITLLAEKFNKPVKAIGGTEMC